MKPIAVRCLAFQRGAILGKGCGMSQSVNSTILRSILVVLFFVSRAQARTITVGLNPGCEFTTIQTAIDAALPGDTILVADGTYAGPGNRDIDFRGKNITVASANGPDSCRIDCLKQGRGVLFHSGEDERSVFDGFAIIHGTADYGGGICCIDGSSPTIKNCVFQDNEADQGGGGIYIAGSGPVLANCTFIANRATCTWAQDSGGSRSISASGGAMLNNRSNPTVRICDFRENLAMGSGGAVANVDQVVATFVDCIFESNVADEAGGAMSNVDSTTTVIDCRFRDNSACSGSGGAVVSSHGTPTFTGCLFDRNWAQVSGGAVACLESSATVTSCVFRHNSADESGGALSLLQTRIELEACIFLRNHAEGSGGAVHSRDGCGGSISNCLIAGNKAERDGGALSNCDGCSPALQHCAFEGNLAGAFGGAICNAGSCSPTMVNCLLVGNKASNSGGALCNRDGSHPALTNCTISHNLSDFAGAAILNEDSCGPVLTNCIVWANYSPNRGPVNWPLRGGETTIRSCCVQTDAAGITDSSIIRRDPAFATGPLGRYYLSHAAAGQTRTSPCCDAGVDVPSPISLAGFTTRTDHTPDSGPVDIGYHYPSVRVLLPPFTSSEQKGLQR